jgi:hypothetical protein
MPAVGIQCKSQSSMVEVSFERCLECSYYNKQECPWVYPVIKNFIDGIRKVPRLSPTVIFGCPRKFYIQYHYDYYLDIYKEYQTIIGRMIHKGLEDSKQDNAITEEDVDFHFEYSPSKELEPMVFDFHGTPDEVNFDLHRLRDWKFTGNIPPYKYCRKSHKLQLNVYRQALLKKHPGKTIDTMEVVYIDTKRVETKIAVFMKNVDIQKAWNTGLEPYYWMQKEGRVPAAKIDGEDGDDILCSYCNVQKQCLDLYHTDRIAEHMKIQDAVGMNVDNIDMSELDTLLGGI